MILTEDVGGGEGECDLGRRLRKTKMPKIQRGLIERSGRNCGAYFKGPKGVCPNLYGYRCISIRPKLGTRSQERILFFQGIWGVKD